MEDYTLIDLIIAAKGAHRAYMDTEYWSAAPHFKKLRDELLKQARAHVESCKE